MESRPRNALRICACQLFLKPSSIDECLPLVVYAGDQRLPAHRRTIYFDTWICSAALWFVYISLTKGGATGLVLKCYTFVLPVVLARPSQTAPRSYALESYGHNAPSGHVRGCANTHYRILARCYPIRSGTGFLHPAIEVPTVTIYASFGSTPPSWDGYSDRSSIFPQQFACGTLHDGRAAGSQDLPCRKFTRTADLPQLLLAY